MARKQTITKEMLQQAAMDLATTEGIEAVTARKVAEKAGCSTQPIFRIYENMDELVGEVIHLAGEFFAEYYQNSPKQSDTPLVDLGYAYISFAVEYEKLFQLLFASHYKKEISTYEFINGGERMYVLMELKRIEGVPPKKVGSIFSNFWTFVNGLGCMVLNGDYDLSEEECRDNLKTIYSALYNAALIDA